MAHAQIEKQDGAPIQEQETQTSSDKDVRESCEIENVKDEGNESVPGKECEKKTGEVEVTAEENKGKNTGFGEGSSHLSDLKEYQKKALLEFSSQVEEAILCNKLGGQIKVQESETQSRKEEEEKGNPQNVEEDKQRGKEIVQEESTSVVVDEHGAAVDKDIALWGVPLLPSKGDKRTDVILLKFLQAREFRRNDAFNMLNNTLQWRKQNNIDTNLDEDFGADLQSVAFMDGKDREGHPVCYNIFGVIDNDETYEKVLGTEEKREQSLRWRIQMMEKSIKELDFSTGGVSRILQISDLKNTRLPTNKDLCMFIRKAIMVLQDYYPESVAKNIFINVPFWFFAFSALLSPFITPRAKDKFVYARASKVTDTLLKHIPIEEISVHYGGLKRSEGTEFTVEDVAMETIVKAGSNETIEIPAPEAGKTIVWEVMVSGWEVNYKEEFVPSNEKLYTVIVQKERKIAFNEGVINNSFNNNEPGNVVVTIDNNGSFKKKPIYYRYKVKESNP